MGTTMTIFGLSVALIVITGHGLLTRYKLYRQERGNKND